MAKYFVRFDSSQASVFDSTANTLASLSSQINSNLSVMPNNGILADWGTLRQRTNNIITNLGNRLRDESATLTYTMNVYRVAENSDISLHSIGTPSFYANPLNASNDNGGGSILGGMTADDVRNAIFNQTNNIENSRFPFGSGIREMSTLPGTTVGAKNSRLPFGIIAAAGALTMVNPLVAITLGGTAVGAIGGVTAVGIGIQKGLNFTSNVGSLYNAITTKDIEKSLKNSKSIVGDAKNVLGFSNDIIVGILATRLNVPIKEVKKLTTSLVGGVPHVSSNLAGTVPVSNITSGMVQVNQMLNKVDKILKPISAVLAAGNAFMKPAESVGARSINAVLAGGIQYGFAAGGLKAGAAIGSLIPVPVVGTLVGAVVGAGVGYFGGVLSNAVVGSGMADAIVNRDLKAVGNAVVDTAKAIGTNIVTDMQKVGNAVVGTATSALNFASNALRSW
jgi:hypothetical protein